MSENISDKTLPLIYDRLTRLANAVGKEKIPIIRRIEEEEIPFLALWILLNPMFTLGIGEKALAKEVRCDASTKFCSLVEVCYALEGKTSVTNQDIANVQEFLKRIDNREHREFAAKFITKTLTVGVSAKTVNKAVGHEAILDFTCMLAEKLSDFPQTLEGKSFAITEKLDGIRCLAVVQRDKPPILYTRHGQVIGGLHEIENELLAIHKRTNIEYVLDGELLISARENLLSKEQYKRTTMIVRKDGPKQGVTLNAFDLIGVDTLVKHNCDTPYYMRRQKLETMFHGAQFISVLPVLYCGDDFEKVNELLTAQIKLGHEGVMVNTLDGLYEFKRSRNLLKVKKMQDCDLMIIGVQEGTGRLAGTLGSLVVNYKGNPVGVGSGISDVLRAEIWANQDEYIGRVAKIQYFEETQSKIGKKSIRFPVFIEFRERGKEVSYS